MDLKIIVIGKLGSGKTSIIQRYTLGKYSDHQKSTIGTDFAAKTIPWTEPAFVRLKFWDIAGQETFSQMTRVFYQGAQACIIVFDISDKDPFESVLSRKRDLDDRVTLPNGAGIPCLLLANKCDLPGSRPKSYAEIKAFAETNGFIGWWEVSAKKDLNINESLKFLVERAVHLQSNPLPNPDVIQLQSANNPPRPSKPCCS